MNLDVPTSLVSDSSQSAEPPAKGSRRWWIGLAAILAVVAGRWFLMPRSDPRFVGTWRVESPFDPSYSLQLRLNSNGICDRFVRTNAAAPSSDESRWNWRVDQEVLLLEQIPQPDPTDPAFVRMADRLFNRWNGVRDEPTQLRILNVQADRIRLMTIPIFPGYQPSEITFIRVPD